jgi:hypothetical protein
VGNDQEHWWNARGKECRNPLKENISSVQYLLAQLWLKELPSVHGQPNQVGRLEELQPIYAVVINE